MNKFFKTYVDVTLKEKRPAANNIIWALMCLIVYIFINSTIAVPLWIIIVAPITIVMDIMDFIIKARNDV